MRDLCKEEDYEFLGMSEKMAEEEAAEASVEDWRGRKEATVRDEVSETTRQHCNQPDGGCVSGPLATGEGATGKREASQDRGEQEGEYTPSHTHT